jgi:serine/threonine protein kinase
MKKYKDQLSTAFKFRILLDIAKGMAFLHSNGVFHRDIIFSSIPLYPLSYLTYAHIKPDNILLISDNIESHIVAKINGI